MKALTGRDRAASGRFDSEFLACIDFLRERGVTCGGVANLVAEFTTDENEFVQVMQTSGWDPKSVSEWANAYFPLPHPDLDKAESTVRETDTPGKIRCKIVWSLLRSKGHAHRGLLQHFSTLSAIYGPAAARRLLEVAAPTGTMAILQKKLQAEYTRRIRLLKDLLHFVG